MNKILILRGPSGVGKSTVSGIIQSKLGDTWSVIDVDGFKHFMPMKAEQSNRAERTKIAHDVSMFFAKEMYDKGYNVILEEMYKKHYNDRLVEYLKRYNMHFLKVFITAPVETVIERARLRDKEVPDDEIRRHYSEVEAFDDDLVIDSSIYSSEEIADFIIRKLENDK